MVADCRHTDRVPSFERRVLRVLRSLAPGEVVTYGEVAAEAGFPKAARAVGNYLRMTDQDVPWWRVVTADGRLVPGLELDHARRLRAEGVAVVDNHVTDLRRRALRRSGGATPPRPTGRSRGR
jgi:methylated-DNA-protein-cysteine methyltransferase-like protein